jgi:hypothetical protein
LGQNRAESPNHFQHVVQTLSLISRVAHKITSVRGHHAAQHGRAIEVASDIEVTTRWDLVTSCGLRRALTARAG